jgi:hypothetical protein
MFEAPTTEEAMKVFEKFEKSLTMPKGREDEVEGKGMFDHSITVSLSCSSRMVPVVTR